MRSCESLRTGPVTSLTRRFACHSLASTVPRAFVPAHEPNLVATFSLTSFRAALNSDENTPALEANLVSVTASLKTYTDSRSEVDVKMGYFWVLNSVPTNSLRTQRLLVHSELPRSPSSYAKCGYDILKSLEEVGALESGFSSASLARVTIGVASSETNVNAKLESLEVHYNPSAIKATMAFAASMLKKSQEMERSPPPLCRKGSDVSRASQASTSSKDRMRALKSGRANTVQQKFMLSASFGSLQFNMNSALDDMPLFHLGLVRMKLDMEQEGEGLKMDASLDDLSVSTPMTNDRIDDSYKTILGLAPGVASSLITIAYFKSTPPPPGLFFTDSDSKLTASNSGFEDCGTFAHVTLSKLRFVHLQAQILMLVEYMQEGIIAVLTDSSSSNDHLGEVNVIAEESPPALFKISASMFEILLPEHPASPSHISLQTSELHVIHHNFANEAGGRSFIELRNLVVVDDEKGMICEPVNTKIKVDLPSSFAEVSASESRSDELRKRVLDISANGADTAAHKVSAADLDIIFKVFITTSNATRYARCRLTKRRQCSSM